jgi:hypothetical protein
LSQVVWVILPLKTYLVSYELVNWELPLIVPVGIVADELTNPNAVICADELIKFEGKGWTLPLIVYLVSYEAVSWDEPLTIPSGLDAILFHVVWVILPLIT